MGRYPIPHPSGIANFAVPGAGVFKNISCLELTNFPSNQSLQLLFISKIIFYYIRNRQRVRKVEREGSGCICEPMCFSVLWQVREQIIGVGFLFYHEGPRG